MSAVLRIYIYRFLIFTYIAGFFVLEAAEAELLFGFNLLIISLILDPKTLVEQVLLKVLVVLVVLSIISNLIELAMIMETLNPMQYKA